jgi:hypothetical protein
VVLHKDPFEMQSFVLNVNKKIQLDATARRHLFTAKSLYMFRASQRPSSGVLKTATATSGIGHMVQLHPSNVV